MPNRAGGLLSIPRGDTLLLFASATLVAYASLRAGSALLGEPDPRAIGPTVHVAYFWRVSLATWLGGVAAAAHARFGLPRLAPLWHFVALFFAVTVALLVP